VDADDEEEGVGELDAAAGAASEEVVAGDEAVALDGAVALEAPVVRAVASRLVVWLACAPCSLATVTAIAPVRATAPAARPRLARRIRRSPRRRRADWLALMP
jgi:hypothetical protein